MPSFVRELQSPVDGARFSHREPRTTHLSRPLLVRYELAAVERAVERDALAERSDELVRWRELLPFDEPDALAGLGERATPLLDCPRLAPALGLEQLWIKDESLLPTGSFKARGMWCAVNRARELGLRRLAVPSAGNAGGALAAYAARAGLEAFVFLPADTPIVNQLEAVHFGARVFLVDGLIGDCAAVVRAGAEALGWFDCSTLKEPYRLEGKKTMGLELALDFGWRLPDVIVYPTGGGTGLIGMAKAFEELAELGWLEGGARPRFYACQAEGCAPIVRAFEHGQTHAEPFANARTVASGLRVPAAVGDFLILDAVRASGGAARAAREDELLSWMRRAGAAEGLNLCPETGACLAALAELVRTGAVRPDERVVVFNTGAATKYVECLRTEIPRLPPIERIRWDELERAAALAPGSQAGAR